MQPSPPHGASMAYNGRPGIRDEMLGPDGVRPHWQAYAGALGRLGDDELRRREQELRRLLRQNGATYNLYGHADNGARPWDMDPIPLLLDAAEWRTVEAGLKQRAELLDRVLRDLYGPRRLVAEGVLPPELVYGHGGFLLPAAGSLPHDRRQLQLYAADLARGPDGGLWVLSDRTQDPEGAGYALENRTVAGRVLADLFSISPVRRLSFFFLELRSALVQAAGKPDPRIVVLTAGPRHRAYFEHAYLASYLGYPLVQAADLTVRDGRVWLKALDGLQPVDVILRRHPDGDGDPLELDGGGVPGLLEAVRRGSVSVVNPIGSGVLENPGLMAFLPSVSRFLLGEELKLRSATTWWCGQAYECQHVLENLERLIIKSIFPRPGARSVLGSRLTRAEVELWRQRIRHQPHLYVGQEQVDFSTSPSLAADGLEPRHVIVRAFLAAGAEGYVALPGGLARSALERENFVVTRSQSLSKDVWVLADHPERPLSLWLPAGEGAPQATPGTLPSRAAENLFWVGRYAERAEGGARWLRTLLRLHTSNEEFPDDATTGSLRLMLRALTLITATRPGFVGRGASQRLAKPEIELRAVALDAGRAGSLAATVNSLMAATYNVRDRWSSDSWRVLDTIEDHWTRWQTRVQPSLPQLRDALDQLVTDLVAFTGLNMESMTRALGWTVLDIGRRLERAALLCVALRTTAVPYKGPSDGGLALEGLLESQESLITYRNRYRAYLDLESVLDLLLLDGTNPRSLVYQIDRLARHIGSLPRARRGNRLSSEEGLVTEALTRLRLADPHALAHSGEPGRRRRLDRLLADMEKSLEKISDALNHTYFVHARLSIPLTGEKTDGAP